MPELNLTAKTKEEQKIKAYLEANASSVLADKINNGVRIQKDGKTLLNKKTLADFMQFACNEAKKQAEKGAQTVCIDDDIVFGWAIHYFEEPIEGKLCNEDGTEYKMQPSVTAKAPAVTCTPPKPQPKPQLSMFDLLDNSDNSDISAAHSQDESEEAPSEEERHKVAEQIAEEEPPLKVDLETGEIIPQKIETDEPVPTVSNLLSDYSEEIKANEQLEQEIAAVMEQPEQDEDDDFDIEAFNASALALLYEKLGDEITLR